MSDPSDRNHPFLDQLERLASKSRSLREKATEANQKAAYVADSIETFATGFRSILNTRSTEDDDLQQTISTGFDVGSTLERTLDDLYSGAERLTSALDLTLPVFSSSSSTVVATCNSLALGTVSLPFRKCPFLSDSDEAGYADKLGALDSNLGNTYRSAWNAFYAEPHDPGRTALWQMRQVYDELFSRLGPDEVVRRSAFWCRKVGEKPNAVHRDERLRYAATRWITDVSQRQVLLASVEETVRTYRRLGKAHERGPIPVGNAREIFLAVDSIIKRWVDAINPWPPKEAA
jgi:hypothetical protein